MAIRGRARASRQELISVSGVQDREESEFGIGGPRIGRCARVRSKRVSEPLARERRFYMRTAEFLARYQATGLL